MGEILTKLRPDRDLQCYFHQPSAVAALSETSTDGFTVSGSWRQQYDWAVVEWNRNNVFEHPALRNLPDGDLRGVTVTYEETRSNCIPMDSTTYDGVGWSYLRVWEESDGAEQIRWVPLKQYATPVHGVYVAATARFQLQGTPTAGDYVELSWLDQHANYLVSSWDTMESIVSGLAGFINGNSDAGISASADGSWITLTYTGGVGANGNRVGVYGVTSGARTESWSPGWSMFSGGASPDRWRVTLDFDNLLDSEGQVVSMANVRKLRWTWSAEWQWQHFARGEFAVVVSGWVVNGPRIEYRVAGPGSRRIEDDAAEVTYSGEWLEDRGNYSGGSVRYTRRRDDLVSCQYTAGSDHELYLGTRYLNDGGHVTVQVDEGAPISFSLRKDSEDVLVRLAIGPAVSGSHVVSVRHDGAEGTRVDFDFLEVAMPATSLPEFASYPTTTLATDWDTDHSLAIAPERTAWLQSVLGFKGRANHYAGGLKFYELSSPESRYAEATIEFSGTPEFSHWTEVSIAGTAIRHLNLWTDTAESIAKCYELLIAAGTSAAWARADGARLTITARAPGAAGNGIGIGAETASEAFAASRSQDCLSGGLDAPWYTDLSATPRLNRAVRDWSRSYFRALRGYGIDAAAAFSMELGHGDDRLSAGIAQRYPNIACHLTTPALQTNFGPESTAFWQVVYRDMADVMTEAGFVPYLQFGEVQWWYFANAEGMPFYDDYTKERFRATYDTTIGTIASQWDDPSGYPHECELLPKLIGEFTASVMNFVRLRYPNAKFEVLYPPDTNDTALDRIVNFPAEEWTPEQLDCLKTENFTFTGNRNLDQARRSIQLPGTAGFPPSKSSHLVGIGDPTWPWQKEWQLSLAEGVESAVLFAIDQFCLIGYELPLDRGQRRALFMGN